MDKKQAKSYLIDALKGVSQTPFLEADFFLKGKENITIEELDDFVLRRAQKEPLAKIIGEKGFWKNDFFVNQFVLDPRPDSEILIEAVLKKYPDLTENLTFLDIGTGSGCLIISLLNEYLNAKGIGIDISEKALLMAKKNQKNVLKAQKKRLSFFQKDFYEPLWGDNLGKFDVIISNPPYIATKEIESLEDEVKLYDPLLALDGGKDGLEAYRALSNSISSLLSENGSVFLEVGYAQASEVIKIFKNNHLKINNIFKDYAGIERILEFSF